MQRIDIPAFKGMAPRVSPALLEDVQGVTVTGVVTSGELRPWRVPALAADCDADTRGIYLTDSGEWLTWNEPVQVHPSVGANDAFGRIYYTRESGGLFAASPMDDWAEVRAGVPKPADVPTVVVSGSGSGTIEDRVYVYTYVNDWGEEGPPSEPSEFHEWQTGKTVKVSGFAAPPLGFKEVVALRIYRIAIGDSGADWFFVDEILPTVAEYTDAVAELDLGEALSTSSYDLPPDDARGLVALGNGIFACFDGNEICFSEPYLPYAWPDKFRLSVAGSVVALGVVGNNVVVLTNVSPYYIQTSHPSVPKLSPDFFSQVRLAELTPCISPRGVVSTPSGVIFPAPDGLRVLDGNGPSKLITEALLSAPEWVSVFDPVNIQAAFYDNTYFAFHADNGLALHIVFGVLTRTGRGVQAMHTDGLSLFVAYGGGIYEWAGDVGLTQATFRSKVFRFSRPVNFAAIRIDSSQDPVWAALLDLLRAARQANETEEREVLSLVDEALVGQSVAGDNLDDLPWFDVQVSGHLLTIWADGEAIYDDIVGGAGFARLPSGFLAREWQFELRTYSHVKQVTMGTSVTAIKSGQGGRQ